MYYSSSPESNSDDNGTPIEYGKPVVVVNNDPVHFNSEIVNAFKETMQKAKIRKRLKA